MHGEPPVLRDARSSDAAAIAAVYNPYVENSIATFEETPVAPETMAERLEEVSRAGLPWLVAETGGRLVGYAYASRWKSRCAYRYAVEASVYLEPAAVGHGLGTRLFGALLARVRGLGMHAVIAGVALPNPASVRLIERQGFRRVAHFEQVGFKQGRWIDVAYWQTLLPPA